MRHGIQLVADGRGVVTLTLNRPEVGNAYDEDLLRAMTAALDRLADDDAVRALVIRGAGKHFQAGADINWLSRLSRQGPEEKPYAVEFMEMAGRQRTRACMIAGGARIRSAW